MDVVDCFHFIAEFIPDSDPDENRGCAWRKGIGLSTPCQRLPDDPHNKKASVGLPTGAIDEFLWDRDTAVPAVIIPVSYLPCECGAGKVTPPNTLCREGLILRGLGCSDTAIRAPAHSGLGLRDRGGN